MAAADSKVSVVMPVYNGAATLDRAIQSVLAQSHEHFECIVLDNCSTDATPRIAAGHAARDPRVRVRRNPELYPVMRNHNVAVEWISEDSDYCQILQADDVLAPDCLARKVAVGDAHPEVAIVGAFSDRGGRRLPEWMPEGNCHDGREISRLTLLGRIYPFISPSSLLFRADVVRARRPFYSEVGTHGDVQACYEILETHDFGFVHQCLTEVGVSSASLTSRQTRSMNRLLASNLEMFDTYGPRFLSPQELQERRAAMLSRYYRELAWALLDRRERDFWRFHKRALSAAGSAWSTRRLLGELLRQIRHQPRDSARRLARSFGYQSQSA